MLTLSSHLVRFPSDQTHYIAVTTTLSFKEQFRITSRLTGIVIIVVSVSVGVVSLKETDAFLLPPAGFAPLGLLIESEPGAALLRVVAVVGISASRRRLLALPFLPLGTLL